MTAVVEIDRLGKRYERGRSAVDALVDASLAIEQGEIFALLGPNGAGKTTLIGCVTGLVTPTSGRARVLGHDVVREAKRTRHVVGLVPQEINFDPFFDVEESLRFQAGYFGVKLDEARLVELLRALGLLDKRNAWTRALSGGMKRRLLIAKALVHRPRVLFLDEPTAGVDVELRADLWRYVRGLRDQGTTIVLTTHYLEEAEELADRIGLIDKGRILLVENKDDLMRRFGEKRLRLELTAPAAEIPASLAARGARLESGGAAIALTLPLRDEIGPILVDVAAAGLAVRDVDSTRSGLGEIYVKLLRGGANGGAA
jgi:ABC-2 type transport system ATP-binding protein